MTNQFLIVRMTPHPTKWIIIRINQLKLSLIYQNYLFSSCTAVREFEKQNYFGIPDKPEEYRIKGALIIVTGSVKQTSRGLVSYDQSS